MSDLLEIGKIVRTCGLRGMLKAVSFIAGKIAVNGGDELTVVRDGERTSLKTRSFTLNKGSFSVAFEGMETLEAARNLIGASVWVGRDRLEPLAEGEYYWVDLIGLTVITETGEAVGRIEEIFQTGSNDVYVCRDQGREVLLPAIADVVRQIDLEKKTMLIRMPTGI